MLAAPVLVLPQALGLVVCTVLVLSVQDTILPRFWHLRTLCALWHIVCQTL